MKSGNTSANVREEETDIKGVRNGRVLGQQMLLMEGMREVSPLEYAQWANLQPEGPVIN